MINLLLFCIIHSYLVMDDYLAIHFEIGAKFVLIIVVGFSLKKKKKRFNFNGKCLQNYEADNLHVTAMRE